MALGMTVVIRLLDFFYVRVFFFNYFLLVLIYYWLSNIVEKLLISPDKQM